jgi:hypothetical protein
MWPFRRRPPRPQSDPDNPLYRLFLERGARAEGTHKWHHYFDIYAAFLDRYRGRSPTLIEIGVQRGGSLAIWREWFGPGARIVGLDVDPACADRAPEGTRVMIGDQSDRAFLRRVLAETGTPDIVIDDGGHTANQQITAFEELYPRVAPDGLYIVEDTHTAIWGGEFADRADGQSFLDFAFDRVRDLHGWTGQRDRFGRYRKPPERRSLRAPSVPDFTRSTLGVSFFDSVVVFERGPREEPWSEDR